jgi:hypothetical protein
MTDLQEQQATTRYAPSAFLNPVSSAMPTWRPRELDVEVNDTNDT